MIFWRLLGGVSKRKKEERKLRKNDIIESAERLFISKGYENTTMNDIAKEAEYSKRTLYTYFSSKKELYVIFVKDGFEKLYTIMKDMERKNKPSNAYQRLKAVGKAYVEFYIKYPDYFHAITEYESEDIENKVENKDIIKECDTEGEKAFVLLINILEQGVRDGSFIKDLEIKRTAIILWANIIGYISIMRSKKAYVKKYHDTDILTLFEDFFDFNLRAIKNINIK